VIILVLPPAGFLLAGVFYFNSWGEKVSGVFIKRFGMLYKRKSPGVSQGSVLVRVGCVSENRSSISPL